MIPIEPEPENEPMRGVERCYFCQHRTDTWHMKTNQPVCKTCAKTHKVSEVPPCVPGFKGHKRTPKRAAKRLETTATPTPHS
jgi:hypothetical protein